jgi:hypothetical protein
MRGWRAGSCARCDLSQIADSVAEWADPARSCPAGQQQRRMRYRLRVMPWQRHETAILLGLIVLVAWLVYGLTRPSPGCAVSSERQAIGAPSLASPSAISSWSPAPAPPPTATVEIPLPRISAPPLSAVPATGPGEISHGPAPAPPTATVEIPEGSARSPSVGRSAPVEIPSARSARSPLAAPSHKPGNC